MRQILNASRPGLIAIAFVPRWPVAIGRFLLALAASSVLTMLLTQHIWAGDHFLQGGQDFESGMLTIVIILCLAVLLTQVCKRQIALLYTVRHAPAVTFRDELPGTSLARAFLVFLINGVYDPAIGRYSLPFKIQSGDFLRHGMRDFCSRTFATMEANQFDSPDIEMK